MLNDQVQKKHIYFFCLFKKAIYLYKKKIKNEK